MPHVRLGIPSRLPWDSTGDSPVNLQDPIDALHLGILLVTVDRESMLRREVRDRIPSESEDREALVGVVELQDLADARDGLLVLLPGDRDTPSPRHTGDRISAKTKTDRARESQT